VIKSWIHFHFWVNYPSKMRFGTMNHK